MWDRTQKHPGGRPRLFKSPEELEAKINEYFKECDERVVTIIDKDGVVRKVNKPAPYTLTGLALHLGMDRRSLLNYSEQDEFFPVIARARARCAKYAEEQLFEGNDRGAKFALMNNYEWVDQQEININATATMEMSEVQLDQLKSDLLHMLREAQERGLLPEADVVDVHALPVLDVETTPAPSINMSTERESS